VRHAAPNGRGPLVDVHLPVGDQALERCHEIQTASREIGTFARIHGEIEQQELVLIDQQLPLSDPGRLLLAIGPSPAPLLGDLFLVVSSLGAGGCFLVAAGAGAAGAIACTSRGATSVVAGSVDQLFDRAGAEGRATDVAEIARIESLCPPIPAPRN
jgi:hypothetical protein